MKKMIAIVVALMLCVTALSVPAFAAFDTVESLAIVGTGIPGVAEWDPADAAGDMTEVSEGIWEKTLVMTAGTAMKFKVAGNDTWDDSCNFGSATIVLGEKADLDCSGGSGDMPFTAEKDMTIKITVDLTGEVATILVAEVAAEGDEPTDEPADEPTDEPADEPTDEPADDTVYYVTGSADWLGNWTADFAAGKMTKGSDGVWSITFSDVAAGDYSLKVTIGNWDKSWGGDGEMGNLDFNVAEAGEVTVKFNPATEKVTVIVNGNPATGDMNLAAVAVAMLAATAGLVVIGKKKEF